MRKNRTSVFLMICSITDRQGRPMESREKLEVLSDNFHKAIKGSLRRGDYLYQIQSFSVFNYAGRYKQGKLRYYL